MPCLTCPFNEGYNDEADRAQNLGCLPSAFEILQMKDQDNKNWECHSVEGRICSGLQEHRETETGSMFFYKDW